MSPILVELVIIPFISACLSALLLYGVFRLALWFNCWIDPEFKESIKEEAKTS